MSDLITALLKSSKTLEDRFYFSENKILVEQLSLMKKEDESIEALSRVSGIVNHTVLRELVKQNIRPEILAALCLVPVIEVAWADGTVDANELSAILESAKKTGSTDDLAILKEWLHHKPDSALIDAWKTYMHGLCEILDKQTIAALKTDILCHAKAVASASGGFLGLVNPISPAELAALDTIADFFQQPGPCHQ